LSDLKSAGAFDVPPRYQKTVLDNGVRVVTEHHQNTRTTSVGFFIDLGSRDEPNHLKGAAHFIEHLVFKGTKKRSAYDIVSELEAVGGEVNAYTSREHTCFHSATLREDQSLSVDVLSDLISQAQFKKEEFIKEREVILQEIDMSADNLEEYIFDIYFEKVFAGHNLGTPILGTEQTLMDINRDDLYDFYKKRYGGEHLIISVAGDVDHDLIVSEVSKALVYNKSDAVSSINVDDRKCPEINSFLEVVNKPSEHTHCLIGFPSSAYMSDNRFDSYIVNTYLGGGMTSKLYQEIREKLALCYSVYTYLHSFTDNGLIMMYAGTSEKNLERVLSEFKVAVDNLKKDGISDEDLNFFKRQVKGQIMIGADDIENRMTSLAVNEMVFGEYKTVDSVLKEIDRVSNESISRYIKEYLNYNDMGVLLMGPVKEAVAKETVRKVFSCDGFKL